MAAPQAGQKREAGSTCLPHLEQNMGVSGRFYFATGRVAVGLGAAAGSCGETGLVEEFVSLARITHPSRKNREGWATRREFGHSAKEQATATANADPYGMT